MVDGAVAVGHPAFARSAIEQRGFATTLGAAIDHGTAVASLMVGNAPGFTGSAPGARLYAADVYGAGPTGGSAEAVVRALDWMASNRVPVINVSLVGPANLMLETAVRALRAKGELLVAPVGNDGPAAPPQYPASYPGVIAVTAVDAKGRLLPEAGRARHVEFAARGAGVTVARPDGGYDKVRGTSFAAPVVAGKLGQWLHEPDRAKSAQAIANLAARARKAGDALGHGVVGEPSAQTSNTPC
jgi:subtilisin family serine protease